jgi:deoxyadenosine/deoxycytidine kinase
MQNIVGKKEDAISFQIVSIDGNIGSGKSTFLEDFKQMYKEVPNIKFLQEPVDEWSAIRDSMGNTMLQKFYADQDKYAFSFQMMAYISRLALMQQQIKDILDNHHLVPDEIRQNKYYIFTERSLCTDREIFAKMLYDQGKIEDVNYQIYLKWFNHFAYLPDAYVYIETHPDICLERISKRARDGEDTISIDYLTTCHVYHDKMFENIREKGKKDILVLNGDKDNNQKCMIAQMKSFLQIS